MIAIIVQQEMMQTWSMAEVGGRSIQGVALVSWATEPMKVC